MRGSFYSTTTNRFGEEMRAQESTQVVESFKMSNILELNQKEKQILAEIKRIITEECDKLDNDIQELQTQML